MNRLSHKTAQNICLLTFADGLVELLKTKPDHLNYGNNIIYINSNIINDKILDNFVEYNVVGRLVFFKNFNDDLYIIYFYIILYTFFNIPRDLTSKMKDKAVCHIIIIITILNMFTIDLSWVSPFLPSSSQKR